MEAPLRPPLLEPLGGLVPDVHRIAVLRANALGDFLLTIPALEALRAAYPEAEITCLGDRWHPAFLGSRPGPWDRIDVVPPHPGITGPDDAPRDSPELDAFFARHRAHGYDLVVQLHGGGANSNPFVRRLGARLAVGSRDVDAPPLDRWTPYVLHQHEVLRFLEVVGLVGATPVTLEPRVTVTTGDRAEAAAVLPEGDAPLVCIHPGANDARRRWPAASFAAVADVLAARGARIAVVGQGDADAAAATAIRASAAAPVLDLVGRLSLGGLAGLLSGAALVVANDSGPRHLAAAVGTPTVGVFWLPNLVNAGPLTRNRQRVLVATRAHCPECGRDQTRGDRCPHDASFVDEVTVADVVREALALYDATSENRPGPGGSGEGVLPVDGSGTAPE